jgi:hypothetical protein
VVGRQRSPSCNAVRRFASPLILFIPLLISLGLTYLAKQFVSCFQEKRSDQLVLDVALVTRSSALRRPSWLSNAGSAQLEMVTSFSLTNIGLPPLQHTEGDESAAAAANTRPSGEQSTARNDRFRAAVERINQLTRAYNMIVPQPRFQRPLVSDDMVADLIDRAKDA